MDIMAMLSGTSTAITLAKAVKDAEVSLDVATIKAKMAEILSELADAKLGQAALVEENAKLKSENARLLTADTDIGLLVEVDGYRYKAGDNGYPIGWPACPSCLATEKAITILVQNGPVNSAICPRCKAKHVPVTSFVGPGLTRQAQRDQAIANGYKRMADRYSEL